MADISQDDEFSDDDLDALPPADFFELQQHAVRSTQQQQQSQLPQLPPDGGQSLNLNVRTRNPRPRAQPESVRLGPAQPVLQYPSSDYGDLEDAILEGEVVDDGKDDFTGRSANVAGWRAAGENTQREQWRQQRFGAVSANLQFAPPARFQGLVADALSVGQGVDDSGYHDGGYMQVEPDDYRKDKVLPDDPNNPLERPDHALGALSAKVAELLREREILQKSVQAAKDEALAKAGEIAIVRANQAKTSKENEQRVTSLQKLIDESAIRQKAELENIRLERERIATENSFLKRDLTEEAERAKRFQRTSRGGNPNGDAPPTKALPRKAETTPKKNKQFPYRDGFDDDELIIVSPSKSKPSTPKIGAKRKRKAVDDSPIPSLQLRSPKVDDKLDAAEPPLSLPIRPLDRQNRPDVTGPPPAKSEAPKLVAVKKEDGKFEITQKALNHRRKRTEKLTLEALSGFNYPSQPDMAISSTILEKLSSLSGKADIEDFPAALASLFISLWSQCVTEKYYKPLYLLMDMVKFLIMNSPPTSIQYLIDDVVYISQQTADINVLPRFWRKAQSEINPDVDTNECLQILQLTAHTCISRQDDISRFWRCMRFDFVVMVLRHLQPIEDIRLMLSLLHTSVLPDTFAMIINPGNGEQTKCENVIVDRVTAMLVETPKPPIPASPTDGSHTDEPQSPPRLHCKAPQPPRPPRPYSVVEVATMRLRVLSLLEKMCDNKHCGSALARSPVGIGRLVRIINDELAALYNLTHGHDLRAQLVNEATRLLYHLVHGPYRSIVNLQEKLRAPSGPNAGIGATGASAAWSGGAGGAPGAGAGGGAGVTHKFLIALTRLAFSEGTFFERGIEDDVVECAYLMLEDAVTPEEGDALLEAFSSSRK